MNFDTIHEYSRLSSGDTNGDETDARVRPLSAIVHGCGPIYEERASYVYLFSASVVPFKNVEFHIVNTLSFGPRG